MLFSQDIGIDLGTGNTLVCEKSKGIIIREPSVVAVDVKAVPSRVVAVGEEAKSMLGRTPGSITAIKPLKDSVIADYDVTADMLKFLIKNNTSTRHVLSGCGFQIRTVPPELFSSLYSLAVRWYALRLPCGLFHQISPSLCTPRGALVLP